jgi:hypothetical protein
MWRRGAVVALAAVMLWPAAARADDAELGGGNCLRAEPPTIEEVYKGSVSVNYRYKDSCFFPAKTSLEWRKDGGDWRQAHETSTGNTRDSWDLRYGLRIDLGREGDYEVRSRVDYLGAVSRSSAVDFDTGAVVARDVTARADGPGIYYRLLLTALVSETGTTKAELEWRSKSGSNEVTLKNPTCGRVRKGVRQCEWKTELETYHSGSSIGNDVLPPDKDIEVTFVLRNGTLRNEYAYATPPLKFRSGAPAHVQVP